jgi:protein gp37
MAIRFGTAWGPNKPRRVFKQGHWDEPLRWDREAAKKGIRRRVFSGSMCDVFDPEAPAGQFFRLLMLIQKTPNLDWLLLTKRPQQIERVAEGVDWSKIENVWLGVTVESWSEKWRMCSLRQIPCRLRFISAEPLLESLGPLDLDGFSWLIAGAESGPRARPMCRQWARELRDQCTASGVSYFYKQEIRDGQKIETPELDGKRWIEIPENNLPEK